MGDIEAPHQDKDAGRSDAPGSVQELVERIRAWLDALLHPPVLVPVPVPVRPSR